MTDSSRRQLERLIAQGDAEAYVKLLKVKVRTGEIRSDILGLAGVLGFQEARQALGWLPQRVDNLQAVIELVSQWEKMDSVPEIQSLPNDLVVRKSALRLGILLLQTSLGNIRSRAESQIPAVRWRLEDLISNALTVIHLVTQIVEDLPGVERHQTQVTNLLDELPNPPHGHHILAARILLRLCLPMTYHNNSSFWNGFLALLNRFRILREGGFSAWIDREFDSDILKLWAGILLDLEEKRV